MPLIPIEPQLTDHRFHQLRLIATDMDGTLTQRGKFTASLLQAFEDLIAADIPVLIVTGRSAGWVSGLLTLPIAKARGFLHLVIRSVQERVIHQVRGCAKQPILCSR